MEQQQASIESLMSGSMTYDGTAETRVRIRNWQLDSFDDPGEPFQVYIGPAADPRLVELMIGQTVVRNPDGSYGIEVEAREGEGADQ